MTYEENVAEYERLSQVISAAKDVVKAAEQQLLDFQKNMSPVHLGDIVRLTPGGDEAQVARISYRVIRPSRHDDRGWTRPSIDVFKKRTNGEWSKRVTSPWGSWTLVSKAEVQA